MQLEPDAMGTSILKKGIIVNSNVLNRISPDKKNLKLLTFQSDY